MELTRIDTIVQFSQGSSSAWNNVNIPVPAGAVVIDTVNKTVKEGDGTTLFASLPICLDYNFHANTSGAVIPQGDDVGGIAIADDSMYGVGNVKLTDLLTSITNKNTIAVTQQYQIDALEIANRVVSVSEGVIDGTIVVCDANGHYAPGDKTLAQLMSDLIATANTVSSGMHIDDLEWYSDSELKNRVVTPNEVTEQNTFWCKVTGFHDTAELGAVDFGLATAVSGITITTAADEETCAFILSLYGGAGTEIFNNIAIDSKGNIFSGGYTTSEGMGGASYGDILIIKFDSRLNILAKKRYGGTGNDASYRNAIAVDKNDNVFVAGSTASEGTATDALVIKFDNNLSILAKKRYGGAGFDSFYALTVDTYNNVICAGYTTSEGTAGVGLVVKFNNDLTILHRKYYGGTIGADAFSAIASDSNGNIFCGGYTRSEGVNAGPNYHCLIVKFSTTLAILARKYYSSTAVFSEEIRGLCVDSNDNVFCSAYTLQLSTTGDFVVMKFDNNLNLLTYKILVSSLIDAPQAIFILCDADNNVYLTGNSIAVTAPDGILIKLDNNLNVLANRRLAGLTSTGIAGIAIDSNGDILIAGNTLSEGAGGSDGLIVKIPKSLPAGPLTGLTITGLTFSDTKTFTEATGSFTLVNSTLTLADSALTLADSALTFANSNLTSEREVIVAARYTEPTKLITTIYTSNDEDRFIATTVDSVGNILAVGYTNVAGVSKGVVVKFDSNFVAVARKIYTGDYSNVFNSVITDASNNIICVGSYTTSSGGLTEAFIVKFDPSLASVITHKTYGATGDDVFNDVTLDPSGNIIVVGYTTSEGSGLKDALVIKFSSVLAIIYKKRYGGAGNDVLLSVAVDSTGNTIAVGWTSSEGTNTSGLVLKLDVNLNIILRKVYNSTLGTTTEFAAVTVTAANVIYCCGRVVIAAGNKGLIVKFDSSVNVTANRLYGNKNGNTEFTGVNKDSAGNVFCVGKTNAEGAGNYDALAIKFSGTLSILGRKTYGTVGMDADIDCSVTADGDLIMSGYSVINGSTDAVITKMPNALPAGVYTNKYFTDLILSDSKLTLSDDNAVVSNSTLSMADSTLTLTNGSMVLSNASGAIVTDKTIMDAIGNVFKVEIGNVVTSGSSIAAAFSVITDDGDKQVGKVIGVNVSSYSLITALYGGTNWDVFQSTAVDSNGNIIAVGHTNSEGIGNADALIVKYDSNLNILAKKRYGGTGSDTFNSITIDSNNNIFCVGYTFSESVLEFDALIVKFDSNLNILAKKRYGGTGGELFNTIEIDSNNNAYCIGYSGSESLGGNNYADAIIIKFDSNLNILAKKRYGGLYNGIINTSIFNGVNFQGIAISGDNTVYISGWTNIEGAGGYDALIFKLDSNLNVLAKRRYGGTGDDVFYNVAIDNTNNVYAVGYTYSEKVGECCGLIVKFDSNLNILIKKYYTNLGYILIGNCYVDSDNNLFICGRIIYYEEASTTDALIVKFDSNLNILAKKRYGGTGDDSLTSITMDTVGNTIYVGRTSSESLGSYDTLIVKIAANIPSGSVTGSIFTNLTLRDASDIVAFDSNLIVSTPTMTWSDSALTLATITTLTLADSALTARREVIVS